MLVSAPVDWYARIYTSGLVCPNLDWWIDMLVSTILVDLYARICTSGLVWSYMH